MRVVSLVFLALLILPLSGNQIQSLRPPLSCRHARLPGAAAPRFVRELRRLYDLAAIEEQKRNFAAAGALLQNAIETARSHSDHPNLVRLLLNLGNVRLKEMRYREAAKTYQEARQLSEQHGDSPMTGILSMSLSTVYYHLWAFDEAAEEARRADQALGADANPAWRARLLQARGRLAFRRGRTEDGQRLLKEAAEVAAASGDRETEAAAWDALGVNYLLQGSLTEAEAALCLAFRLRKLSQSPSLYASFHALSRLRLRQGDAASALVLIQRAMELTRESPPTYPVLSLYLDRAKALRALGRLREARLDAKTAMDYLRGWRPQLLPAEALQQSAAGGVQDVYSQYIHISNTLFAQEGDEGLIWESFAAAEETRLLSQHQSRDASLRLQDSLPPGYGEHLAKLQAAQAALFAANTSENRESVGRLRSQLIKLEMSAALDDQPPLKIEPGDPAGFRDLRGKLGAEEALLSFYLDDDSSYLWTITAGSIQLHALPPRARIASEVMQFRQLVQTSSGELKPKGAQLYRLLFDGLPESVKQRERWIIVPDGVLHDLPFAALLVEKNGRPAIYLAEERSIRLAPAAAFHHHEAEVRLSGPFLGVADPVYNTADARWANGEVRNGPHQWAPWRWFDAAYPNGVQQERMELPLLPGTEAEIRSCLQARLASPGGTGAGAVVLTGMEVNLGKFRQALASAPAIVHLATHIVPSPADPRDSQVAFSLREDGQPEFLGSSTIRLLRARPGLVVMSGCQSGGGKDLPGQGRLGLTRAWLAAGAGAVAATYWPVTDDRGGLLRRFYRRLFQEIDRAGTEKIDLALQRAQVEMIQSRHWEREPAHWASLFVMGVI